MPFSPTDTIVAIATAPVRAGIGVVRISGPRAHAVARAVLTVPHDLEPRHATLTYARTPPALSEPGGARAERNPQFPTSPRSEEDPSSLGDVAAGPIPPVSPEPAGRPLGVGGSPEGPIPSIDEVIATFFPAPHSYTAEDVVEISAHGSLALLREIVRAAITAGARLAEPGEFTLRAFLNGRLDLVQAEAVADLVDAVTPLQARVAFDQLEGTLTRAIGAIDGQLFDVAARLEASVDFPEEGYHFVAPGEAAAELARARDAIDALLATSQSGRVIREGRHIAILGKPNVGKSSLFNALVGTDRAIVAAGPGTTRDMLRETIDLDGLRVGLVDTAGIRASEDEVEQEGVARARKAADVADLVIVVLDRSRPLEEIDAALLGETAAAPRLVVVNKIDMPAMWSDDVLVAPPEGGSRGSVAGGVLESAGGGVACREPLGAPDKHASRVLSAERGAPRRGEDNNAAPSPHEVLGPSGVFVVQSYSACSHGSPQATPPPAAASKLKGPNPQSPTPNPRSGVVRVSIKTGEGLAELRAAMHAALDVAEPLRDAPIVTNVRHEALLRQARESITQAIDNVERAGAAASEELILADIGDARRAFEEVTGKRTTEDVLRRIFERFCIGK